MKIEIAQSEYCIRYRLDASLHSRVLTMRGKAWEPATTRASLASAGYITRELFH